MKTNINQSKSNISQLNLALIALAMVLLVLYIFNINKIAVLEYSLNSTKAQLAKGNALTQAMIDDEQDDEQAFIVFAKANNMTEVKNYDTFFQEVGVALK